MIRHLLKLVWRRKRANALLIVEIFFSFLVFFAVVTFGTSAIMRYNKPLNFDWHDVLVAERGHSVSARSAAGANGMATTQPTSRRSTG